MAWFILTAVVGGSIATVIGIAIGYRMEFLMRSSPQEQPSPIEIDADDHPDVSEASDSLPEFVPIDTSNVSADELRRIRIHEVGHAVAAKRMGIRVFLVTGQPHTNRKDASHWQGVTHTEGQPQFARRVDYYARIVVRYAGHVAEDMYNGGATDGNVGDLRQAEDTAVMLIRHFGRKGGHPRASSHIDMEGVDIECEQAYVECCRILEQEKAVFDELMGLLETQPSLSGDEIDAVWTRHHPSETAV